MVEGVEVAVSSTSAVVKTCLIHLYSPDNTPNIVGEHIVLRLVVEDLADFSVANLVKSRAMLSQRV